MGDGFDGFGYGSFGFLIWFFGGLPLAILLFLGWGIYLFTQSQNPYEHIRKNRIKTRYFLLRSIAGIIVGSIAGFIILFLLTGNIDDCNLFQAQLRRSRQSMYSAEVRSIAQQKFQTMNCPAILKYDNTTLLSLIALLITSTAPSIGLICAMKLNRKS
jgi:hypothetical protein